MSSEPRTLLCDWNDCPSHLRKNVRGRDFITVIWHEQIYYFHATDCLAFWAASFPIGYVSSGDDADADSYEQGA